MYSIAICDDDKEFAQSLLKICGKIMLEMKIHCRRSVYYNADDVMHDFIHGTKIDLLILDIKLNDKNGIDVARKLRDMECDTSIILISADDSYLLEGYTVQPVYFLLKPFAREDLIKAISADLKRRVNRGTITVRCNQKQVEIMHESILYLEVMDHVLTIHTLSGNYDIRTTLTQILGMLPEEQFCRCHNSYAVNLARIADISRTAGITLDCSVNLPIGRKYYNDVQQRFIKFINRN